MERTIVFHGKISANTTTTATAATNIENFNAEPGEFFSPDNKKKKKN